MQVYVFFLDSAFDTKILFMQFYEQLVQCPYCKYNVPIISTMSLLFDTVNLFLHRILLL